MVYTLSLVFTGLFGVALACRFLGAGAVRAIKGSVRGRVRI